MKTPQQVVLETLENVNYALWSDPNACVSTMSGEGAHPEAAYMEIVQELLKLIK